MYRATLSLALILVVVALVAAQWSAAPVATADSQYSRDIAVLLVDGDAMRHAEGGVDLASSFVGLLSALQDDRLFVFMSVDAVSQTVGPYRASDPEYPNIQDEIEARMKSPSLGHDGDLAGALLEARETLSRERASAGSEVYLITGDSTVKDFARLALQISPLVDRFSELGWRLNGVTLPGASPDIVGFLDRISSESGGRVFELSDSDGLRSAADAILAQDVRGSLSEIGSRVLVSAELMSSVVSIVPGTSEFTLMLFRENPEGSLHLSNPSGFDVSPFDRAKTQVIETPNAVIWKLKDPAPGNWRLDSRGMRGLVSAWEYSNNNYILVLVPTAPVPLGQPISLVAYVQEGDRAVALEGVRLFANITTPAGTRVVIEMKDDGTGNDGTAGDGNYTMMLPPLGAEGGYKVELELVWLEYNHRISTFTGFEARVYPRLSVDTYDVENIEPGERVQVATVLVHVEGEPYPVAPEQMIAILNTSVGSEGEVEVVPRRVYGDGPAFEYDVFLTVRDPGRYSLAYRLSTEYAGRLFTDTTDSMGFSSAPPPRPAQAAPPPVVQPAPVTEPVRVQGPIPAPAYAAPPSGFPWMAVWIPIALLVVAGAVAAYMLTRTRPFGYIYGDDDEPLVDFAAIRRRPLVELLRRGSISGGELGLPGLEGVVFRFARDRIRMISRGDHPTVRINNQPLDGQAMIENRTWIGVGGKLYTFLVSPSSAYEAAGAD